MATIFKKDSDIVSKLLNLIFNDKIHLYAAFDRDVLLKKFSLFCQLLQMYGQLIIFGCAFLYMKFGLAIYVISLFLRPFCQTILTVNCKGWSKSLNSTNYIFN